MVFSVLIGGTRVRPLVGQSGDDDIPKRNTSNSSLYCGGSWRASGDLNANVPFMEDYRLRADGLMARLIPKSLTLVTNEATFNNTLLGLRS